MRAPANSSPSTSAGYAVVDVETTGLNPAHHRVIEIAVSLLAADGSVEEQWSSLVRPPGTTGPVHIHGITRADVEHAPTFVEISAELSRLLTGRVLVAHNAAFDWSFLAHEAARCGVHLPVEQRLCTVVLARRLDIPARNLKLGSLAEHWNIPVTETHRAAADVATLVAVLRHCLMVAESRGLPLPLEACLPVTD